VILERDERPLHRTRLGAGLAVGLLCLVVSAAWTLAAGEPWVALASLGALLGLAVIGLGHRRQLLTDRSLIDYSPALAWLARRLPRLAPFEARRRRVIRLGDVLEAQRAGARLLLRPRVGRAVHFQCADEQSAADLLRSIEALLRQRGGLYRPSGTSSAVAEAVRVVITPSGAAGAPGGRCPYCHDEVPPEEGAACEQCGVVHHAECLDVHGGCAAFACQGRPRGRVRTGS
jgi:hypothetical protein